MTTSAELGASDTGRRSFAIFTRLVAVFVGLANLAVLAWLIEDGSPSVRGQTALADKFSSRYAFVVMPVCFGGVLMSLLLASVLSARTQCWLPGRLRYLNW